jgi:hypothetical protein
MSGSLLSGCLICFIDVFERLQCLGAMGDENKMDLTHKAGKLR